MNRNSLILLLLKDKINDIYLCNTIMKILFQEEYNDNILIHKKSSFTYLNDILLLYPGFIKTALFERFIYNEESELDPGHIVYNVQPLTRCGNFVNWDRIPPERFTDYEDPIDTSAVTAINKFKREENLMKMIYHKLNHYKMNQRLSIWYEFESGEFIGV